MAKSKNKIAWRIKEPLNFNWDREYVYLDVPNGAPDVRAIRAVTDGTRTIAAQYDPARNALLACIDLPAAQEVILEPSAAAPPDTGLRIEERPGLYVLRNSMCSACLRTRVSIEDAGDRWIVAGPIASVVGPDGLRRCGSRIVVDKSRFSPFDRDCIARVSPAKIAAEEEPPVVEISLEDVGDVFARYRYKLTMSDGRAYLFTATLYADYPVLFVREETDLGRDGNLQIMISKDFGCDTYFFGGAERRPVQVPLPPYEYRLGSLTPHHTQTHTAYPWIGFMQSDRPQGTFRGICDTAIEPYADAIVIMAHKPWDWHYPGDVTIQFHCHEGRRVTARGPLRRGMRSWCMFITSRTEAMKVSKLPVWDAREVSVFSLWHRKINDLPLDWLRRLDLTSGAIRKASFPQSVLTKQEYESKRKGIFKQLAPALAEKINGVSNTASLYARWVLSDDREAARKLAEAIIAETETKLALIMGSGFMADGVCAVSNRGLGPDAVYYEACVAAGVLTDAEDDRLRTVMLLLAHATAGDALFPSHHNYWPPDHPKSIRNWAIVEQYSDLFGTPNFQTDVYYNLGLFGAVFTGHPSSQAWMAEAADQLDRQLALHFHPGGVYKESLGYFAHLFHNMLSLASVLKRHGVRDFFADERFQNAMGCFVDYLGAPRRPTVERIVHPGHEGDPARLVRFWPAIGDTGHNCSEASLLPLVAHAAWEVRLHNRGLSDRLLAAWSECGRPLWGAHMPSFEFLYIQDLAPKCKPLRLKSRNFVNVGPVMRADVGLPSETSIFVRSGRATHHWGFDHGHFTVTTRGSLLIPDFGYHGTTEPAGGQPVHGSMSAVHNIVTFGPDWNGGTGMERQAPERAVELGDDYDYVVCDLCMNNVRHNNWRNIQHISAIEYFRHLLFAHNRYIFVWDRIDHSVYASQLRVHCLSRSVAVSGAHVRFEGLDDVDLIVNMIEPAEPEFHEGMVGPQRFLLCEQDCQRDYVWVCQPVGPGEAEFEVAGSPNVVTIKGKDLRGVAFEDSIAYARSDFGAAVSVNGKLRM